MARAGGQRRRVLAMLAAVLAAGGVVVGAMSAKSAHLSVVRGENVFVNPDGPIDANNSPTVARNPTKPDNVVVAHRVDLPRFSASLQVSTDSGRAWLTKALPLPPDKDRPFAADVAFAPDGTLYVSYVNLEGNGNRPDNLWIARSDDGGQSLSAPVKVAGPGLPLPFQARIAVDTKSVVHITHLRAAESWGDGRNGDLDVFVSRSDAGGATWGEPVRVNTNRLKDGTDQYMPRVAVAPSGRVDVLFFDRRRDPGNVSMDAYLGVSIDDGASFDDVRVSSNSFDSRVGFSANPKLEADLGSRLGLASTDDEAFAVWTDTRLGTEDTARQDIAAAAVRVDEEEKGSGRAPAAAALLVAAGVCMAGWWLSARPRKAASTTDTDARKADE